MTDTVRYRIEKIKEKWTKDEVIRAYKALIDPSFEKDIENTKMESVLFEESYAEAVISIIEEDNK